jgi:alanyl-tRNA synthetase
MPPRSGREIRESFLSFFEGKGHQRVASAPVVPQNDPTLLFVNAGMVPFKRVFLGEEQRAYKRAVSSQKVFRVSGKHNDLEAVGRSRRHHTFFEMLGNFSFGDYFKREAIVWSWELITDVWQMPPERLHVSVFREDDEAAELWEREIGLAPDRIHRLGEDENFWSMGDTGPCGPCSEIHWDYGRPETCTAAVCDPSCECGRWREFWNLVFMQFNRDGSGHQDPLPSPCVDTGAGLERVCSIIQDVDWTYETDLFAPIVARAEELSGKRIGDGEESDVSLRVVADHARAITFLLGDGVLPDNEGRGYVLRRILRRASRHGWLLGIEEPFLHRVADAVIEEMGDAFPEVSERRAFIEDRVLREEERFLETLGRGIGLLEEEIEKLGRGGELGGDVVFKLYDTFGFPVDLTADVLRSRGLGLDQTGFERAMAEQRGRSRESWKGSGDAELGTVYGEIGAGATVFCGYDSLEAASEIRGLIRAGEPVAAAKAGDEVEVVVADTPFYAEGGGQVGDRGTISVGAARVDVEDTRSPAPGLVVHRGKVVGGEIRVGDRAELRVDAEARAATVRNHSGTHLLHAALREVLGPQAMQKGSLVAPDRLRFDFTHDAPLTEREVERIEDLANAWIEQNAAAQVRTLPYKEAIAAGAVAIFEEKYGDEVRVVSFGDFSTELCGGTHARATGDIGLLKVVAEAGIAAGVRRIEALTGLGALHHLRDQERELRRVGELLRVAPGDAAARVERLLEERKEKDREIASLKNASRGATAGELISEARELGGTRVLAARAEGASGKELRGMVDDLRGKLGSGIVLLAAEQDGRVSLALGVTPDLKGRFPAGDLVREVAAVVGGKGGGRPDFAQAGGSDATQVDAAFERLFELVQAGP